MLNICSNYNAKKNEIIFSYIENDYFFSHKVTSDKFGEIINQEALALVSIYMRPKNSDSYRLIGVDVPNSTLEWINRFVGPTLSEYNESVESTTTMLNSDVRWFLAFSGGFDSVAAHYLLKDIWPYSLGSVDYGGSFSREALFFSQFNTSVIKSDIRSQKEKFNENIDWRFLVSPLMLLSRPNEKMVMMNGTIMEASPFWFSGKKREISTGLNHVFGVDWSSISPVGSITEYGTTLIASKVLDKDAYLESLKSLASENSFKRYRKQVLHACIYCESPPKKSENIRKHIFGTSFGEDMVALYVTWKLGRKYVSENYCDAIPESFDIDMSFFEKINMENIKLVPTGLRNELSAKLKSFDLEEMTEFDLINIDSCVDFRKKFLAVK